MTDTFTETPEASPDVGDWWYSEFDAEQASGGDAAGAEQPQPEEPQQYTREQVEQFVDALFAEQLPLLREQGVLPHEPVDREAMAAEQDRVARLETTLANQQALDGLAETFTGWGKELGFEVDPQQVIEIAGRGVQEALDAGYLVPDEHVLAHARQVVEQLASEAEGDRVVTDQIAREGRVFGLTEPELPQVRSLAEMLFENFRANSGREADLSTVRDAVSCAVEVMAIQPTRVTSARTRVAKFGRLMKHERETPGYLSDAASSALRIRERDGVLTTRERVAMHARVMAEARKGARS